MNSTIRFIILLATLSFIPTAWTQTFEHSGSGPDILLFEHASMGGEIVGFFAGDQVSNLEDIGFRRKNWNDEFSSIEIRGPFEVYLYEHAYFQGRHIRVSESIVNLSSVRNESGRYENWNDRVSSIRIERCTPQAPLTGPDHPQTPVATIYSDAYFAGYAIEMEMGDEFPNLKDLRLGRLSWNDAISSIEVLEDVVIELFSDANFSGEMIRIDRSQNNLDRARTIENRLLRWNDAVSSIRVRPSR